MTNDPTYDEQLALLKKQDFSKPASDMLLPGNVNPVDRFQRAAYYSALLPKPKNEREAAASILAIARNEKHALKDEAKDLLELYVEEDFGTDWDKWEEATKKYLKEYSEEGTPSADHGAVQP